MRNEANFNKKFKMEKLAKMLFNYDEKCIWDKNLLKGEFIPIIEGVKSFGKVYSANKRVM